MRIKSRFRDYYDCMQAYGTDDMLYIRDTKDIILKNWHMPSYTEYIGVCGKIYPLFIIDSPDYLNQRKCWTIEDCDKASVYFNKANKKKYWDEIKKYYVYSWNRKSLLEQFDSTKNRLNEAYGKLFDEYKVPIFRVYRHGFNDTTLQLNPCLRPLEIVRILPPYQIWQELLMWIGNLARPEKPIPKIDDRTMAEVKGFDGYSFRKPRSI